MSHVVIVGAGPAGASLAYMLVNRGVQVTLLERQKDFAREFRGEILMPSGIDVFDQMGLHTQLAAVPSYAFETIEIYMNRKPIISETFDASFPSFLAVSQPALLEMLVSEAARSPLFRFERGVSMKDLLHDEDRVVGVQVKTDDGEQEIRADLVIGADGRSSSVRKHAGLKARRVSPPMDIVWCKLPCPDGLTGVRGFAGRGNLLVVYRTWDDTLQLGWVILKGTFGELRSRGIEQWVEEMAHQVSPDLAAHLRANLDAVQKPFMLSTASDCVERWSAPGVLVIGDAAHTMSPVGGQGVNIALRDAIVAANHLVPVLSESSPDPEQLDAALMAIESERMVEVRKIQSLQAQPPKLLLSRAWWGEPLRRVAGALLSSRRVRKRAGKRVSVFLHGVTEVRLSV